MEGRVIYPGRGRPGNPLPSPCHQPGGVKRDFGKSPDKVVHFTAQEVASSRASLSRAGPAGHFRPSSRLLHEMSKQEHWEQLGFASYRDWRLFDASERRKRKRAVALPPTSTSQPVPPSPAPPPIPAPSLPFELPPRAQLLPEYDANGSAEEFKPTPCVASTPSAPGETATEKASRRAARTTRVQRLKDELDQDLYDSDVQEGEDLYEICAAAGGSDLELTEAELSSKDAEFGGSEAEWQELDHDAQLELVLDAVNRRRRGLDKFLVAKASRAKELRCALKPLTIQDVYAMYPSSERPTYVTDHGSAFQPSEESCACGSSRRFQCLSIDYHGREGKLLSFRGCEDAPLINLVARLEREQEGQERLHGEFNLARCEVDMDAAVRNELGEERYCSHIAQLEKRWTDADVEREAAIRNWDKEHWRAETARGYTCDCATWGMLCNCSSVQKIGWQCGSVSAMKMAASLVECGTAAESPLEEAALRVAAASSTEESLWDEWACRVRKFTSRSKGRISTGQHVNRLHLADRLIRSFPGALHDAEMPVFRKLCMHDLLNM